VNVLSGCRTGCCTARYQHQDKVLGDTQLRMYQEQSATHADKRVSHSAAFTPECHELRGTLRPSHRLGSVRVHLRPLWAASSSSSEKPVQSMRRGEHPRAQPLEKPVQAMRRVEHLRAQPHKEQVQGLPAEGGLVLVVEGRRREGGGRTAGRTRCVFACAERQ
jgi:hypothetical protein